MGDPSAQAAVRHEVAQVDTEVDSARAASMVPISGMTSTPSATARAGACYPGMMVSQPSWISTCPPRPKAAQVSGQTMILVGMPMFGSTS